MASNAKHKKDWGQFWLEQFPEEERICYELNDDGTRRRALDITFSHIDSELSRPTRKLLNRYGLLAQQEDVEDYKQKGWECFIAKIKETRIEWQGPSTLFRAVYSCIKNAARQQARREEVPSSSTATTNAEVGTILAKPKTIRIKLVRMPVEDENTSEHDVDKFFYRQSDITLDLESFFEGKEKIKFLTNLVCDALHHVKGKCAQNLCIMWFFMQMSPSAIRQAWGAEINQGRLRQAKELFVDHCLLLLNEAMADCVDTTVGLDFIMKLSGVFNHFRTGDHSNGDLNQNHPLALYLHSLVPSDYIHTPRAADAVETFISWLQNSQLRDW